MDENTKSLYDLYIGAGHTETPEQFLDAKNQMGEEVFNTYINSQIELKKKDQTEIIPIENFSTPSIQETNQMISDNNLNQRFPELQQSEATIIQQNLLEANSTESDSILVPNSTESASISPEKYLPKQDGFFDLLGKYKNYDPNTGVFSGKKRIIPDEEIDRATKFYDDQNAKNEQIRKQNSLNFLAGKPKDDEVIYIDYSTDAINQEEKLNAETPLGENEPKPYLRTDRPFQKKGVEYSYYAEDPDAVRENNDELLKAEKAGELILTTDLRTGEIAKDKFGNYYHTYISDEAIDDQNKYIQSLNDAAREENSRRASYNFGNLFSAPTPETETQQYLNELDKEYGITLLTPEQREQLSTAEGRKNIEIELETQKRLKENKNLSYNTVFAQVSKEKEGADIQQQITNGSNYVKRMFFGGGIATNARKSSVFGEANDGYYSDDERDEYNFYVNYFNNPDNVAAFGAFMDDDGKALFDSSWIKRTNVSQNQEKRKEMFATFLSWKGKQDRLDLKFSQDALETNASKAESYRAANDLNNYRNQVSKVNFYQKKIQEATPKVQKNVNELSNSSQFYSKSNKKANENADFQARVQNDEFSANAQNFIGNVFLGATTSVQNAVTGLLRMSAVPFGKGNVNDFIDIVSEPISVGNVDIARISDEIISLNGNGKEYKKINGYLYEVGENGKIFRPTSKIDENSLKETDRTRNINSSGLAFVTSKMLVDIYLTRSTGAGINSQLSFAANALSNSKKITAIFGEGSQIANQAATFARTMQSPTANMITGWTVQMYNDNYLAAKNGGIENETNRHLYAFTTSFLLSQLQRINPDTNFLKTINTEYKAIVSNLMENNTQKAILGIQSFTKKAWENTSKEYVEENLQHGTQDLINIIVNATGEKNLQVSTLYDYKDVFIGTVVPSLVLSGMGGRVRQAEIGGRKVDLTQLTRNELVTELARTPQGLEILRDFRNNAYFESQQNEADKLIAEIQERQKYINKIPDAENYSTETINSIIPLLQEIDRKQQSKKNDDGTFTARIDVEISNLTTQVNNLLDQDAETTQPTPQPETVQEQGTGTENESQQGTPSTEQNTEGSVENPEIIQQKIKNKNLFKDGGLFANILGGSGVDSVLSGHQERNGIEFIQWSNPNTGDVDVIMTGTGSHDFVGYYRIYENGKPTNKWSSKFENQSRNKDNFKLMISGVQELLPSNHQYTEKTSISSDGLRVWEQQLRNGYEIARNQNGEILTNEVSINGDSINNDLGINVNQGQFLDIEVNNEQDFQNVKKALLPKLIKLGLNDSNIRWDKKLNTVKIDLPILQKIKTTSNNDNNTQNINSESQQGSITEEQNIPSDIEEIESRRKKELDNLPLLPLNLDGKNPQYDIDREEQNKKREEINKRYDAEIEKLKKSNNEEQNQPPIPEQPGITETPSEIGNTPTTTSENLQTEASKNPQASQVQINQEIFSDEINPAELSEEQVAESDQQINDVVSMFENLNTPSVENNNQVEENSVTEPTNVQQNPVTQNSNLQDNQILITDNVIATSENITLPDGEKGIKITVTDNEGNLLEDRNGDSEFEFATLEDVDKFINQKKRGYSLSKNKSSSINNRTSTDRNLDALIGTEITFTQFGENKSGTVTSVENGKLLIKGSDGKNYTSGSSLVQNVKDSFGNDVKLQQTSQQFSGITKSAFDALIEKLKKPFAKAFKNLNVTTDWKTFENAMRKLGIDKESIQQMVVAFHGSPYNFDKFSTEFMGAGEGAQAFGWGLYFTDLESIARNYAQIGDKILSFEENEILSDLLYRYENDFDKSKQYIFEKAKDPENTYYISLNDKIKKGYKPSRNLYKVSLHKGKSPSEYTWLEWDKSLSKNLANRLLEKAKNDENLAKSSIIFKLENPENYVGNDIYGGLNLIFRSGKEASMFLLDAGIDGIKYPAESISRGATSDDARGFNYVVFDENAITIEDKIQFMYNGKGFIYGAKLPDGTIYINPKFLNANTAIHEFSHLWEQVMPNVWKKGLELFKETATGKKLFNQLKSEGNYSTLSDDLIWSEALNTHIGNIGEKQYQKPKGKMKEFVDWFKTTMAKFLNVVGVKNNWTKETNLSAFTDTVLGDLMGERELDVEGNTENGRPDFQIIGERGAANLDKMEEATTRLDNLGKAREMETAGKTDKEIRSATGWEKGVDGKWRYEIKDLSIISDDATVSGYNNLQEWFDGNKRTDGKLSLINFAGITSRQTRREAINNAKNRGFDITNIFDAYPKISEINIELSDVEDSKGSYNPRTNTITLNKKLSFKEADSTLIHEIQHAVQEIEGFASGGNSKSTTNLSNKEIQQVSQVEKAIKDAQNLKNSGDWIYESSSLSEIISSDSSIPSEIKNWAINIVSSGQNEIDNFLNETPFRKYQRLAGETEARNVQTRANMSMAERRATLLSETEDVAREDQIILMDGLGVSESNTGSSINKKAMPKSTFAAVANATSQNGREAGYQELVNSNWFKSLQPEVQAGITSDNFQNTMIEQARIIQNNDKIARQNSVQNAKNKKDEVIKDIKKEFKDKISDLKKEYRAVKTKLDKITNAKERLSEKIYWRKQAVNGIKLLLNDKFIRDKVTHSELRQLLDAAEKITNAININSAFDNFNDKLDKIIDKAEGRANKKDEWEEFKKNPEALQADPTATYTPVTGRNAIVKFKEKWFANQGGLLKPFMNMKDNARGKINWELRIAKNTVQKLLSLQNKLKYNSPENNKTIDEALKGNNESFDKLPDDIKPLIAQMRNQIDGLSAYLVDNNLVTPEQALNINENLGSYVTRGYDYFDGKTGTLRTAERISKKLYRFLFRKQGLLKSEFDTEKWADAVTVFQQNVLNDIAADKKFGNKSKYGEDFHNQSDLAIQSYARTKGEGDLMEYIKSLESDYQKQGSQQKADTSVLERRKDVPEPIRKLLGEYEDPKISFALTISRMSQLAYQRKFMAQLKDQGMGSLFFKENDPNRPATHFVKIASDSNDAFAPLNGLYTTPEFKDVFLDVTEQNINDIGRLWMKATGLVKVGKTVLSPETQMVNFFANPGFLINNGTILDIKNLGASVKVFIDDMKGSKGTDPILQELIEENIIDQSLVFNEIESDFGANIERDLMRNVRQNIAVKTARDFLSIPFRAYKASDDFFKAFTYYAEANRYSKSIFGKKYKELTGEDRIKIRKIASEVTKNTMPNYDRRYKAADYARMKTGNLLGNFLSFQAESIRTKINSIQIAVADIKNPETRSVGIQRMAGIMTYNAIYQVITSYLGKTAGLGLVGLLGFFNDDDEDEANKKFNLTIPDWARSTEKFARKEKDGTITFYTYGNSNPYGIWYKSMNAYQNGSSNNSSGGILSVIDEVATPFFGTEMSADWAVNTFIKEENDWGADLITWEDKARYSWEKLSPTAFKVYKNNMDENDKNNFDIYNVLGIKKYNYNPTEQLGFKFRDWQTKINDLGKKKYNLEMQFANGKIKEEDAVARYEEYNNEQIEITDEFKKVYEAFIFMGADVIKLNEKANSAYINKYNSSRDFLNYLNKNSEETEKLDLKEKGKEIFSK